jgi:cell division transport system permease protein
MKQISLGRITKLGLVNFWRNGWLSLVNSTVLTLTVLIICMFAIFNIVINIATNNIKDKINLSVYFNDSATTEQIQILSDAVGKRIDVRDVIFISKDEALVRWNKLQIKQDIKSQITQDENPLPRSLEVRAKNPESLDAIVTFFNKDVYKGMIRSISYQQNRDIIQKLINISKFSQKAGLIISIIFISISILIILNTVRLAVFTRKQEIEIMRIVGASNYFIDWPFIVESIVIAVMATIFSTILIWIGLHYASVTTSKYLVDISINLEQFFKSNILVIILLELITALFISVTCTFISLRRHIKF